MRKGLPPKKTEQTVTTYEEVESNTDNDPALIRQFSGHQDAITSIAFDSKLRQVASASKDSIVQVWNLKQNQNPLKLQGHKGHVYSVKFSKDGEKIVSAGFDRTIRIWSNSSTNSQCEVIKAHSSSIRSLDFSQDGAFLLSASDDQTLKLWRMNEFEKKPVFTLQDHSNWVRSGVISPDMRLIASSSDDKTVKLWDFNSQSIVHTYTPHTEAVSQVLFHPDGTCLISSSHDSKIKIIDMRSNKLFQQYNGHDGQVNSISVHPTGYFVASAGNDGKIKVWDLRLGRQVYSLYSNESNVSTIAFNAAGDYFASGGNSKVAMVWKTNFDSEAPGIEQLQYRPVRKDSVSRTKRTNSVSSSTQSKHATQSIQQTTSTPNPVRKISVRGRTASFTVRDDSPKNQSDIEHIQVGKLTKLSTQNEKEGIPSNKSSSVSQIQDGHVPITFPLDSIPKLDEDNLVTEELAKAFMHMYSKIDSMVNMVQSLNSKVASKNSSSVGAGQTYPNQFLQEKEQNKSHLFNESAKDPLILNTANQGLSEKQTVHYQLTPSAPIEI